LSGGEKQRVAIARALVNNPSIIFADEPTGNLDSKSGQAIMEIIQDLNEKEGHTIILITHETYTAEHAQRLINVLDGKITSDTKITRRHKARDHFEK
jgi:ABC-type lipoprotein export system ATPase subunit